LENWISKVYIIVFIDCARWRTRGLSIFSDQLPMYTQHVSKEDYNQWRRRLDQQRYRSERRDISLDKLERDYEEVLEVLINLDILLQLEINMMKRVIGKYFNF
jgi:hypothetical protein